MPTFWPTGKDSRITDMLWNSKNGSVKSTESQQPDVTEEAPIRPD